jgi:hypothetical protein
MKRLIFERIEVTGNRWDSVYARVASEMPGGWLIAMTLDAPIGLKTASVSFLPDPEHTWNGNSLA